MAIKKDQFHSCLCAFNLSHGVYFTLLMGFQVIPSRPLKIAWYCPLHGRLPLIFKGRPLPAVLAAQ